MTTFYVINFEVAEAPRRNDGEPWTSMHIEQAPPESPVAFVEIDEQPWTDPTPETSEPVEITTAKATLQAGWYRAWWEDANGARSRDIPAVFVGDTTAVLFTVEEGRTVLGDPAFDAEKILDARDVIQDELEHAVGFALTPKAVSETVSSARGWSGLPLRPYIRQVFAVTIDGTALTETERSQLHFVDGILYGYQWAGRPVTVYYEHGLAGPTPACKRAALSLLADYLGTSPASGIDPRAESIVTVDGTIRLRTDDGGFTNPIASAWVNSNRIPRVG